ncbi:MAG: hypothetical protein ACYS9Y_07735 [Planctomycetota bacterium]|jgi:hypothetical protein
MAMSEYNAIASTSKFMKYSFVWFVILFLAGFPLDVRSQQGKGRSKKPLMAELTVYPVKDFKAGQKYQFLVKADEQSHTDALLYVKAAQSLPENINRKQLKQWSDTPLDKLPRKQVEKMLQRFKASLELVEQAARCRKCQWPDKYKHEDKNLSSYRNLAYLLALRARLQIAEGKQDEAIGTMQTGLTMGSHIGQGSTIIHGLIGVAISALMVKQVEEFVQLPDASSLYGALKALPKPFIDLNKHIELEKAELKKYNKALLRKQLEIQKPAHDKTRVIMKRLDRNIAVLQCVEALRLYAGTADGKFPKDLSNITEVDVPLDPVTGKPFVYSRTGSKAVLEGPAPKGARAEEALRYELNLKE